MEATYISSNRFSVSGDQSEKFIQGRKVKADCGVDGFKYVGVLTSSYNIGDNLTTVDIYDNILTINLSGVEIGLITPGPAGTLPFHNHEETYYTKLELDSFFNGKIGGKQLVDWTNVINKPGLGSPSSSILWENITNKPTNLATTTDISAAINNLIDSAPGTLNTLNELALALGDDPNFVTTITDQLSSKANLSDVYTQTEVNDALSNKANTEDLDLKVDKTTATSLGKVLYVDGARSDSYTPNGSQLLPFKTITDAISSSVGETLILIAPFDYNENITLDSGIHLLSLSNEKNYICSIIGTITYNCTKTAGGPNGNIASICGIDISGPGTSPTVLFTGSNPQRLNLFNCEINCPGIFNSLNMVNTGSGSLVVSENVNFNNTSNGVAVVVDRGKFSSWKTQINSYSNQTSIQFNNDSTIESQTTYFTGQLDFNDNSSGLLLLPIINAFTNSCIVFDSSSNLIVNGLFSLGSGPKVTGSQSVNVNLNESKASMISNDSSYTGNTIKDVLDDISSKFVGGISQTVDLSSINSITIENGLITGVN